MTFDKRKRTPRSWRTNSGVPVNYYGTHDFSFSFWSTCLRLCRDHHSFGATSPDWKLKFIPFLFLFRKMKILKQEHLQKARHCRPNVGRCRCPDDTEFRSIFLWPRSIETVYNKTRQTSEEATLSVVTSLHPTGSLPSPELTQSPSFTRPSIEMSRWYFSSNFFRIVGSGCSNGSKSIRVFLCMCK